VKAILVILGSLALLAASATPAGNTAVRGADECTSSSIGFMTALTGAGAPFGQEQLKFVKLKLREFNAQRRTSYKLVEGDTKFDPAEASTIAQQLVSNDRVMAVVGPGGSQEVLAIGKTMTRARLAFVSPSATASRLTNGAYPTFFRDVPADTVEAPSEANFIISKLKAKKVVIIDDQSAYSVPLSNAVQQRLRARGVRVQRESVSLKETTEYSSLISKIGDDVDLVYLVWLTAGPPNTFGQQMLEQGKRTTIFIPGIYGQFKLPQGGYTSSFAPDIRLMPSRAALVRAFDRAVGKRWGSYGPPTYGAMQIVLEALHKACADGRATRSEVVANVRRTRIPNWILGGTFTFTKNGDTKNAKYYIFKVDTKGKYTRVG
jgi:branched-chain amino acid transport system substrate-binding protein